MSQHLEPNKHYRTMGKRGFAKHRGSIIASHTAAPRSIVGILSMLLRFIDCTGKRKLESVSNMLIEPI